MRHTAIAAIVVGILGFAGGAYASATGLIGSAQIRDHSIRLIDLSPATVRALRGHVGPQGPPGTFDPTKVVAIVGPQVLIFPGQEKSTSATCPPGAVATGGGGYSPDISPL